MTSDDRLTPPTRLAAYGTLMRAWPQHALLAALGAQYLRDCQIVGALYDLGSYPALGPDRVGGRVFGELFLLPTGADLAVLDAYEDFDPHDEPGSLYLRRAERLAEPDVEAWVYRLNPATAGETLAQARVIADGRWTGPRQDLETRPS